MHIIFINYNFLCVWALKNIFYECINSPRSRSDLLRYSFWSLFPVLSLHRSTPFQKAKSFFVFVNGLSTCLLCVNARTQPSRFSGYVDMSFCAAKHGVEVLKCWIKKYHSNHAIWPPKMGKIYICPLPDLVELIGYFFGSFFDLYLTANANTFLFVSLFADVLLFWWWILFEYVLTFDRSLRSDYQFHHENVICEFLKYLEWVGRCVWRCRRKWLWFANRWVLISR